MVIFGGIFFPRVNVVDVDNLVFPVSLPERHVERWDFF